MFPLERTKREYREGTTTRGEKKSPRIPAGGINREKQRCIFSLLVQNALNIAVTETANSAPGTRCWKQRRHLFGRRRGARYPRRRIGKIPAVVNGRYRRHMRPRRATCVENPQCAPRGKSSTSVRNAVAVMCARIARRAQ